LDGKTVYSGTAALASPGDTVVLAELPVMDDDYVLTGWIDLSSMQPGTRVTICLEFYVVEAQQAPSRLCTSYEAPLDAEPVHVKPMYMPRWARARITATLDAGQPVSIPYWLAAVIPDIGVKRLLMRQLA